MAKHVVVVGGGITGLTAAYRLERPADGADVPAVTLLESRERLGGKILTERAGGLTVEGGPDSFFTAKPQALELIRELGLLERLLTTAPADTDVYVYARGRLRRLPPGLMLMAPSRVLPFLASDLLTWRGKLRMGLDLILPAGTTADESLGDFARRRFGEEALRTIVQPVMAGIHAGDADELSLKATFPQFQQLESTHGSVIRGLRRAARGRPAPDGRLTPFVTLAGGLCELVEALAARLKPGTVRLGARVSRIASQERGYRVALDDGRSVDADAVIVTAASWQAAGMLSALDPELGATLLEIPFTSSATVTLAYEDPLRTALPKGFGFLVARGEARVLSGATFTAAKFPGRAPAGTALVRCFLGGAGREESLERPDAELVDAARSDLRAILGLRAEPALARVYRWPRANPQYTVGHAHRVERIEARLALHPGLLLAGASYKGAGIPECAAAGLEAARRAVSEPLPPILTRNRLVGGR